MFDSFISLGWYCGTASAMSRHGLRKMSSPFDWCFSDLYGVIHFLETDFDDFMAEENIQVLCDRPKEIKDIKWGIHFNHEIKENYENERVEIVEKYARRIKKLKEEFSRRTVCFIRAVRNQDEIKWIVNNARYIETVIKKNKGNNIIFLIPHYMSVPSEFPFDKYILQLNVYQGNCRTAMRDMFDSVQEFVEYCKENYPANELANNKIFDLEKECRFWRNRAGFLVEKNAVKQIDGAYKSLQTAESRFQRLLSVVKYEYNNRVFPDKIIIYGAGDIGKLFCDKIREHTQVECFIDKAPCQNEYDGIKIYKPECYLPQDDVVVVVIPTYDFEKIKEQLKSIWNENISIIAIEEFLM